MTQLLYELCTEREMESDQFHWDTTAVLSHMALAHCTLQTFTEFARKQVL